MTISPGWAVELIGEQVDLADFEIELKPPDSPWVERDKDALLLRSKTWASLRESTRVLYEAQRLIEQLNGVARLVHCDAQKVRLGRLLWVDEQGQKTVVPITGCACLTIAIRQRAQGTIGHIPAEEGGLSFMQKLLASAEKDDSDALAELLLHIARADNWYDLYKTQEIVQALVGGERQLKEWLKSHGQADEIAVWESVRRTANHYRHSPLQAQPLPPDPPQTPMEGLRRIVPIIRRVVHGELCRVVKS